MPALHKLPWINERADLVRVAVIGDIILDEYLEGHVARISPEAPVPIHRVMKTIQRPGGAANAALNIQKAGGQAILIGVHGNDSAATDLIRLLQHEGINTDLLVSDHERQTTKKTRVSANRQQIVRIDWETSQAINAEVERQLVKQIEQLENVSYVLISDYGKGMLTESFTQQAIATCKRKGIKVVADPKGSDYRKYQGCYLITPNRKEACEALGLDPFQEHDRQMLGREIGHRYQFPHVLVTLGAEGMYLWSSDKNVNSTYLPATAQEVFDVSGAGDTVAAVTTLALAAHANMVAALQLANSAAAIVVAKWGTHPIERAELEEALRPKGNPSLNSSAKIKTRKELATILGKPIDRRDTVVFTNGCFDILHAGHISYLEQARALGDCLVIGLNDDASVTRLKGKTRPIIPADQRAQMLAALACVDYVVLFDEDTPANLIGELLPNVLVKGADYQRANIVGADVVERHGGQVQTITFVDGLSTSKIIEKVKAT